MQTNELYSLALWFEKNIEQDPLLSYYSKLNNTLQGLTSSSNKQNLEKAEQQKHELHNLLLERLKSIDESDLTDTQRDILRNLDLQTLILSPSKNYLHNLLRLPQDYSYILATLKSGIDRLSQAISSFKVIRVHMANVLTPDFLYRAEIPDNKCLTRLHFQNEAEISNIVGLRDWSKAWYTIARGFSMAVNQPPEDFEVISADKGSVIVDLMLNIEVVKLITETLTSIATLATSLLSLKMAISAAKELKGKMDEETFQSMLEQVTEQARKDEEQIIEKVVLRLKEKELITNDNCNNELVSAIKELTKYCQKGGGIDCIANDNNSDVSQLLNSQYQQLQDKSELKFIEDKKA